MLGVVSPSLSDLSAQDLVCFVHFCISQSSEQCMTNSNYSINLECMKITSVVCNINLAGFLKNLFSKIQNHPVSTVALLQ